MFAAAKKAKAVEAVFSAILSYLPDSLLSFRIADALDIAIVAYIFYKASALVRETRAGTLIKGIILLLLFTWVSNLMQLNTINYLLRNLMQFGIMALLVVFQPELRRALEKVGRTNLSSIFSSERDYAQSVASEIASAAAAMSSRRIGALIVIERDTKIGDIVRTGCMIDSNVSGELLINIFIPNTPLHDGAVIVRGNRITSATCYLPLSDNMMLSKELGTRHRAGVGISEVTDSLTVIVSEETGGISVAYKGELKRNITVDELKEQLVMLQNKTVPQKKFRIWKGWNKNEI